MNILQIIHLAKERVPTAGSATSIYQTGSLVALTGESSRTEVGRFPKHVLHRWGFLRQAEGRARSQRRKRSAPCQYMYMELNISVQNRTNVCTDSTSVSKHRLDGPLDGSPWRLGTGPV